VPFCSNKPGTPYIFEILRISQHSKFKITIFLFFTDQCFSNYAAIGTISITLFGQ
jgi:hypothetical protein